LGRCFGSGLVCFGIICISRGYRDLPLGFYQVFALV